MKSSTKTALIAGGSALGVLGVTGGAWWLAKNPKQKTTGSAPPSQAQPPTPPSPIWQVATTQVVVVPQACTGKIVQDVYSSSLVMLPQRL